MTQDSAPVELTLRRKNWIAGTVRWMAAGALNYHRILVEGGEHLPRQGPGLLLPKHRAYRDILVEGVVLYQETGRLASFVMKVGLWGVLELLGGVKVIRPKDIRRLKDREERRAEIRRARAANQELQNYLTWLYSQDELVVSHPEGMRYQDAMGPVQKEIIEHLLQAEEQLGRSIPLIPIGLAYESYRRPRARVHFRIGEPFHSSQFADAKELMDVVEERLRALSGFSRKGA